MKPVTPVDQHSDAERDAAQWDARLRSPECTPQERAAFEQWRRASAQNAVAFAELQRLLEALRGAAAHPAIRALRDRSRHQARAPRRWAVAAAVLVAGCAAVWGISQLSHLSGATTAANRATTAEQVQFHSTAVGERATITLADGSQVLLNTNSKIETRISAKRRSIILVAGQALFQVAHDAQRPFVVRAGDRDVTALGTRFDVRVDGGGMRVVLVEGQLAIERNADAVSGKLPSDRHEIRAGQEFAARTGAAGSVRVANINDAELWHQGRVAFQDTPLPDAVAEMNRYSENQIVISDPTMARLRINGIFHTSQNATFVHALEEYFPLESRVQADGHLMLVWRK